MKFHLGQCWAQFFHAIAVSRITRGLVRKMKTARGEVYFLSNDVVYELSARSIISGGTMDYAMVANLITQDYVLGPFMGSREFVRLHDKTAACVVFKRICNKI